MESLACLLRTRAVGRGRGLTSGCNSANPCLKSRNPQKRRDKTDRNHAIRAGECVNPEDQNACVEESISASHDVNKAYSRRQHTAMHTLSDPSYRPNSWRSVLTFGIEMSIGMRNIFSQSARSWSKT